MFSALKQLADTVQDGATKLAEQAKEAAHNVSESLDQQIKAAQLAAATGATSAQTSPNAKPGQATAASLDELRLGAMGLGSKAPSAATSTKTSRAASPERGGGGQGTKPTSPSKDGLERSSVDGFAGNKPAPPPKHDTKGASVGDLQMENTTLRDQLHETLSQLAALQKDKDDTATKLKETSSQLDLVKQKARTRLAQLTKEVEELRKKTSDQPGTEAVTGSPSGVEPPTPDSAAAVAKLSELEATNAKLTAELESERRKVEEAEEQLLSSTAEFEQRLLSERDESKRTVDGLEKQLAEAREREQSSSSQQDLVADLQRKVADLEAENGTLKELLEKAETAASSAAATEGDKDARIADLEQQLERSADQLKERERQFEEALQAETEKLSEEVRKAKEEAAGFEAKLAEVQAAVSAPASADESSELREKLAEAERQLEEAFGKISDLESKEQPESDNTAVDEVREKLREAEKQLAESQEKIAELESNKASEAARSMDNAAPDHEELVELRNKLREAERQLEEALGRVAELEEIQSSRDEQPAAVASEDNEAMAEELSVARFEKEELSRSLAAKSEKVAELEAQLEELTALRDTASSAQERLAEAVSKLDSASKRIDELSAELDERDRIAAERRHNLEALEDDLAEAQQSLEKKQAELDEANASAAALEEARSEAERDKRRIAELEAELEAQREAADEEREKSQPPPPYQGPADTSAMEKEIGDLKKLVEELRAKGAAVVSETREPPSDDLAEVLKIREAAWQEEKRALEENVAKKMAMIADESQQRIVDLERMLEEAKRRPSGEVPGAGSPGGLTGEAAARLKELENRNFTLEEQARDFSLQIKTRSDTIAKQQEQLTALKTEFDKAKADNDEKFKKMRSILQQANKSIAETREKLSAAEKEKERLVAEVENKDETIRQTENERDGLRAEMDRLERELSDERELRDNMAVDLESKNRQLQTDLNMARSEFQKYKVKAAMALQQQSSTALESRIAELEEVKARLEKDRTQHRTELDAALAQAAASEAELTSALDRIEFLEGRIRTLENLGKDAGVARQEFESLKQTMELEKGRTNEAIRSRDGEWESKITAVKKEMESKLVEAQQAVRQKDEETGSLRAISEGLSAQLTAARDELAGLKKELEETKKSAAAWAVAAAGHQRAAAEEGGGLFSASTAAPTSPFGAPSSARDYMPQQSLGLSRGRSQAQQGSSLQDLLSRRDSIDSVSSSNQGALAPTKEKEFAAKLAHMAELLNESEAQVTRLMEQEKVLKEEIRVMDRSGKRANLNIEYLKNIVLKFLENPAERQQLILVLTNVLQLTPNELNRLRASVNEDPIGLGSASQAIGNALGLW